MVYKAQFILQGGGMRTIADAARLFEDVHFVPELRADAAKEFRRMGRALARQIAADIGVGPRTGEIDPSTPLGEKAERLLRKAEKEKEKLLRERKA